MSGNDQQYIGTWRPLLRLTRLSNRAGGELGSAVRHNAEGAAMQAVEVARIQICILLCQSERQGRTLATFLKQSYTVSTANCAGDVPLLRKEEVCARPTAFLNSAARDSPRRFRSTGSFREAQRPSPMASRLSGRGPQAKLDSASTAARANPLLLTSRTLATFCYIMLRPLLVSGRGPQSIEMSC